MADKQITITATSPPALVATNPLNSVSVPDQQINVNLPTAQTVVGTFTSVLQGLGQQSVPDQQITVNVPTIQTVVGTVNPLTVTVTLPLVLASTNSLDSVSVTDQQINVDLPTAQTVVGTANPLTIVSQELDPQITVNIPTAQTVVGIFNPLTVAVVLQGLGEENVPDARLFKYLSSEFGFEDGVLLKAVKSLTEGVFVGSQTVMLLQRAVQEAALLDDRVGIAVKKPQVDFTTVLDELQQQVLKAVAEFTSLADNATFQPNKGVEDNATTTVQLSKAIAAVFTEANYFYQDYVSQDYAQLGVNLVDTLTRVVAYTRSFEHLVDATDDFYGVSNIDDDRVAQVLKGLISWADTEDVAEMLSDIVKLSSVATLELTTAELNKPLLEVATVPDTANIDVNIVTTSVTGTLSQAELTPLKVLDSSTNATTDTVFRTPTKGVADAVRAQNLQETVQLATAKLLFSDYSVTDVLSTTWEAQRSVTSNVVLQDGDATSYQTNKVVEDTTNTSIQLTHNIGTVLEETSYLTDVLNTTVSYNRSFNNQITLTDDFYGVGSIDDDQTAQVTKNAANSVNTQDQLLITWQANLAATDTTNTSIQLSKAITAVFTENNYFYQDYVAPDYNHLTINLTDSLTCTVEYNRSFSSQITLTDNFYGVGNIDDDQTAEVIKNAANSISTQDQLLIAWQANLDAADTINTSTQLIEDVQTAEVIKNAVNNVITQDQLLIAWQANLAVEDTTNTSTQLTHNIDTVLEETSYLTDVLNTTVAYSRSFSSQITLTDDFYGVGNIDDDQTAQVTKNAANSVNTQDQLLIAWQANLSLVDQSGIAEILMLDTSRVLNTTTTGSDTANSQLAKVLASPVTNTDVGVVYNQNYFAQSYTALGYAGTITNFS